MVRWCWVNFQYRGVLQIWIIVWQGPTALAVGAGWGVWTFFLSSIISVLSSSLRETARYRLKYCLKGPLIPKQANQPNAHHEEIFDAVFVSTTGTVEALPLNPRRYSGWFRLKRILAWIFRFIHNFQRTEEQI